MVENEQVLGKILQDPGSWLKSWVFFRFECPEGSFGNAYRHATDLLGCLLRFTPLTMLLLLYAAG